MPKKLAFLLVTVALLVGVPHSEVQAENTGCSDGTLVYWHSAEHWVCMGYVTDGPACTLCHGEPINVVG